MNRQQSKHQHVCEEKGTESGIQVYHSKKGEEQGEGEKSLIRLSKTLIEKASNDFADPTDRGKGGGGRTPTRGRTKRGVGKEKGKAEEETRRRLMFIGGAAVDKTKQQGLGVISRCRRCRCVLLGWPSPSKRASSVQGSE